MGEWFRALVLGTLQAYIYDQLYTFVDWMKYLTKEQGYFDEAGNLHVPAGQINDFLKLALKALCTAIRKGNAPEA